ncbi:condensation domain-containing protein, partial [Marilutibacter maris]
MESIDCVVSRLLDHGIHIALDGDKLKVRAARGALSEDISSLIRSRRDEIVDYLTRHRSIRSLDVPAISHVADAGQKVPVSFSQQRLWFIDRIDEGSRQYHLPVILRLSGNLDTAAMQRAIDEIVRRHEVLRTRFVEVDGVPKQIVVEAERVPISTISLRQYGGEQQELALQRAIEQVCDLPFDLEQGRLLRVALIALSDVEHLAVLVQHHIVSDGWSSGVFVREFSALYDAFVGGSESPLPAPDLQYADFALWQRDWLVGDRLQGLYQYWEEQLRDIPLVHGLPLDRPRPKHQDHRGAVHLQRIEPALSDSIREMARQENVTLFMLLQTAFSLLVSRLSLEQDVVIGTPVAGRARTELEPLLGFFVNNLALRSRFDASMSFRDALSTQKKVVLDAYAYQHLPFEMLVDRINPNRSTAYDPVFQIVFAINNNEIGGLELSGLGVTPLIPRTRHAKTDLELLVEEREGGFQIGWTYRTGLFDECTIASFSEAYARLLQGIVSDASVGVFDYDLVGEGASQQLLAARGASMDYPTRPVQQQIAEQAQRTPASPAVVCGDVTLSYAE